MTEYEQLWTSYVGLSFFTLVFLLSTGLFLLIGIRLQRILDRYRLKYGFDRDIERKETSKSDIEHKLDSYEKNFKRRVFKD